MKSVFDFMESSLAVWAKSILNVNKFEYERFPNGEYFYLILKQTDPRLHNSNSELPNEGESYDTTRSRLLNLDFILRNIRSFYQEILNQILLIKLPDIYQIAKYPDSDATFKEMEKMLLLLLGLTINGEFKEKFIEQIQQKLDTQVQIKLVPYIQLVTEDLGFSISKSLLVELNKPDRTPHNHHSNHVQSKVILEVGNDSNLNQPPLSPRDTSTASCSSAASFTASCQQLQNQANSTKNPNQLVLAYPSLDHFNYFMNSKLIPNLQRIVDERDSYLESIIELEQDKDYLAFRLAEKQPVNSSNHLDLLNQGSDHLHQKSVENELKSLTINELIINLVNNSSTICNITSENLAVDAANSAELNETSARLLKLIDAVNKGEIAGETKQSSKNIGESILNELKAKKEMSCGWNQKVAIELVECKIRLKQLINEVEEKCECIESLKDEMDEVRKQFNKLRNENVELHQRAALANVYSDELESLREKSVKVDRYECELAKLKQRIDEIQLDESRLNELKEENHVLIETRTFMEKQLEDYQQRLIGVQRLDNDLNKYKQEIDDLNTQSVMDKRRMCDLCEKNAKLELEMKTLLNQNVNLDEELTYYKQKLTFTSAELAKTKDLVETIGKSANSESTRTIESLKIKISESDKQVKELKKMVEIRDSEVGRLKEASRAKDIRSEEATARMKALEGQLGVEQENKMRLEKVLDQHKLEISQLQLRLDQCVDETKKLDNSIRQAALSNEKKCIDNEENFTRLAEAHDQLNLTYTKLSSDHEELQKLYVQLESEYDQVCSEVGKKHATINCLGSDFDELNVKYMASLDMIDEMEKHMKGKKMVEMACETAESGVDWDRKLQELEKEIVELKEKRDMADVRLKEAITGFEQGVGENERLAGKCDNLFIELNQTKGRLSGLELINEKLEMEKAQLFEQLHILLQQNAEILTQTLANKDLYHEESKAYIQQLHDMKRQKETLEMKIMDQYKKCPSLKKVGNGSNNGLIDMVSKTTRNLVQKVRNKSSTSLNQSIDSHTYDVITLNPDGSDGTNIYENDGFVGRPGNKNASFCHKYSADDINYMSGGVRQVNADPKLPIPGGNNSNSNRNTVSSLSSSSSTSSSSSSSSIPGAQTTPPLAKCSPAPIKYDPKSLKLGGRPQSICSSICGSPQSLQFGSPNGSVAGPKKVTQSGGGDYKRIVITSSPMYQNKNVGYNSQSQEPGHSSSSSSSPCSVSSASMKHHQGPIKFSTPIKSSPAARKSLDMNNKTLTNTPVLNGLPTTGLLQMSNKSQQKITQRIAHELSKFRMSTQMADDDEDNLVIGRNDCHDDDEDRMSNGGGLTNGNKNSNEIWLEYGCI